MGAFPINPHAGLLGLDNAVLCGQARHYFVPNFVGPLSIKTVVSGSACWSADNRRFPVNESCYVVLNDRQPYTITIDSAPRVETFCIFFARGFVEDIHRASFTETDRLLDEPAGGRPSVEFHLALERSDEVSRAIARLRRRWQNSDMTWAHWDEAFVSIGSALVARGLNASGAAAKLPAVRPSTRTELYRRLLRGRDALLASTDSRVPLSDIAAEACLSPYHFHRSFRQVHGITPHQYLLQFRLERAAHLLLHRDRSVTDICVEIGFENAAAFSTCFRRRFGVSPRAFAQNSQDLKSTPLAPGLR